MKLVAEDSIYSNEMKSPEGRADTSPGRQSDTLDELYDPVAFKKTALAT